MNDDIISNDVITIVESSIIGDDTIKSEVGIVTNKDTTLLLSMTLVDNGGEDTVIAKESVNDC